jgi:trans-2-enoyl-CoA reductase
VSLNATFEIELTKLINAEVERITHIIATGNPAAVTDYATYRQYVGMIQGLRRVIVDYIPETNSIIRKGK